MIDIKNLFEPFGAVGDVIEFIFEQILSRIIAHNLPIEICKKLRAYMAKASWKIVDMGYWAVLTHFTRLWQSMALWDAKKDLILISGMYGD